MAVQIQYRRGPASEWTGINPTLALGEPGYETDTGKIKIGTGSLAWNDLVYTAADSFLNGEGAPDASLGKVGDFYLDTTIYHLYGPKTATVGAEWGEGVYLTGNTIRTGTTAPDASIGRDGDFYIDTVANQIYGPKTDTVGDEWGSPTNLQVVSIDDLNDVDTSTAPPQAGEALVWDDSNSVWKPGPAGAEASGSAGQIQYNDGASPVPGLAASNDLAWDDTAKELSVGGDINLDDGGSFSTTVQAVTPTANRTISFPDRTGTVALVSGANGTIQYNDAGTLKGNNDFTVDLDWNDAAVTFTGLKLNVTDGAGGAPVGDAGSNLLDLQVNGTRVFSTSFTSFGAITELTAGGAFAFNPAANFVARMTSYGAVRELGLGSSAQLAWLNSDSAITSIDLSLLRDAADTLAQRRSTNAQTFRLYSTYTDASNFERTSITRDSSGLVIDAQKGGTGADPTNLLDVKLGGTSKAVIDSSGRLGIGTTIVNANARLHTVGGNILAQGDGGANTASLILAPGSTPEDGASIAISYTGSGSYGPLVFGTGSFERARIDSDGRLLVGTSTARSDFVATPQVQIEGTDFGNSALSITRNTNGTGRPSLFFGKSRGSVNGAVNLVATNDGLGTIEFAGADGSSLVRAALISAQVDGTPGANAMPGRLVFNTTSTTPGASPTERMRVASNGSVATFCSNAADGIWASSAATAGTARNLFTGSYGGSNVFSGTISYRVYTNGDVANTNGAYGPISSDERLKQDIVDAGTQWDDIKAVRLTKFRYKNDPTGELQLGPIAQELEQVSPGLITRRPASEDEIADPSNDLVDGDEVLSFKASILYMKAVKALQEAMERIEVLEQRLSDAGIA